MNKVSFDCKQCDFKTNNKNDLTSHVKNWNKENSLKVHKCDICGKIVKSSQYLRSHDLKVHGGQRDRYKCNKCDFTSYRKDSVAMHEKAIHLKIKAFKCETCSKEFAAKKILVTTYQNNSRWHESIRCS